MASYFSWTRAAYVFFVLSLLAALLKIGGSSLAEPRSFVFAAPPEPEATTVESTTTESTTEQTVERVRERPDATVAQTPATRPPRPAPAVRIRNNAPAGEDPPVFYRPSPSIPQRDAPAGPDETDVSALNTGPVCGDLGDLPKSSKAVFPLADTFFDSYSDTWGAPRPQGGHEGTDLMTPAGTPEYAITNGTIVPVSGANGNGWNTLGGYTVMLRADYDVGPVKAGDLFYYAHMQKKSDLRIGTRVRAGQLLGYAGDTGQGPEVTSGLFPPHLHLGWYDASGARTNLDSGAMNPFPLLEWLKANGGAVAGGSDVAYCEAPQPPAPVPSTGGTWTYPTSPGARPDMDTGAGDARPSPVVKKPANSAEQAPGVEKQEPPRRKEKAPADEEEARKPAVPEPKPAAPDAPRPKVDDSESPALPDWNTPRVDAPRVDAPRVDAPRDGIERPVDRSNPAPPSVSSIRDWVTDLLNPSPRDGDGKKRPDRGQGAEDKPKPDKRQKEKPDRPKRPKPPAPATNSGCDAPGAAEPCAEDAPTEEETTREETTPTETTGDAAGGTAPAPPDSAGSGFVPEVTQAPEASNESSTEPAPEGPEGTPPQ